MQEHPAEPDRRPVHEYEFARHLDRSRLLQSPMHLERLLPAIHARAYPVGNGANAIFQHRAVDEIRPDIEDVDDLVREAAEAPGLVSMDDQRPVFPQQTVVKVDHALNEFRREGAHAAIVEEIDPGRPALAVLEDGVIAEMRVAVDHPVMAEWIPPGAEHGAGDLVAFLERARRVVEKAPPLKPAHGEEPLGAQV